MLNPTRGCRRRWQRCGRNASGAASAHHRISSRTKASCTSRLVETMSVTVIKRAQAAPMIAMMKVNLMVATQRMQ